MNTKEQIMPLYVGKCKVKTKDGIGDYERYSVQPLDYKVAVRFSSERTIFYHDTADCQLILDPLSSMSEEDKKKFDEETIVDMEKAQFHYVWQKCLNEFLWLIEHGYALSDSWFTGDNPIAVTDAEGR